MNLSTACWLKEFAKQLKLAPSSCRASILSETQYIVKARKQQFLVVHFFDLKAGQLDFASSIFILVASNVLIRMQVINKRLTDLHVPHVFPAICSFEWTNSDNTPVFCVVYEYDDKTTTLADYVSKDSRQLTLRAEQLL
jgi:hypothetical protein